MKKRLLALMLAMAMVVCLAACGGNSSEVEAASEQAAEAPQEEASVAQEPEAEAPAEEAPAEEVASVEEEPEEPAYTVSYPIPGEHTLSLLACRRFMAEALGDNDYSAQYVYPELVKQTGVSVDFTLLPEVTFNEQINLIIASQEYPDIFANGVGSYDQNLIKAIEDDVVLDLSDYLPEYAPDYLALLNKYEDFADLVYNSDGSICSFQTCKVGAQSQGLYIRGDWLEKSDLEVPTTIDELGDALSVFHTEYGSTLSLLITSSLTDGLASVFNHADVIFDFNMIGFQQTAPDSGEVVAAVVSDGFFDHMTFLRELYAEEIINSDYLSTSKEAGNYVSSYYSGKCGVWYDGAEIADPVYAENASDPDWLATPMVNPTYNGEETHMVSFTERRLGPSGLIISAGCEIPEVAVQFLNYGYTPEGKDLVGLGIEGETFTRDENGKIAYTEMITGYEGGIQGATWLYLVNSWMQTEEWDEAKYLGYGEAACATLDTWTEAAKNSDDSMTIPATLALSDEEINTISQYVPDLCTYFAEISNKYVMGEIDADAYKAAYAEADTMGLPEVTAAYQAAFDRYNAE